MEKTDLIVVTKLGTMWPSCVVLQSRTVVDAELTQTGKIWPVSESQCEAGQFLI